MRLASLHLQNFRNFEALAFESLPPMVGFIGPNGAGKTNILEAISLLTPGRGLRNAALPQILRQNIDSKIGWGVRSQTTDGLAITTGWQHGLIRRALSIGSDAKASQKDLAEVITAHWLTPAMDRMLAEAPAGRRRFIDRLVFALDPAHAGRITRYEKAVLERMKLLKEGRHREQDWLTGLELDAAHSAASIAAARVSWLKRVTPYINTTQADGFPQPMLAMHGLMEGGLIQGESALMLERQMVAALAKSRTRDAEAGSCSVGPHRTDIAINYAQKNQDARLASTGEQKALLISLILAQTHMLSDERGIRPILLLDDIASHLDESRRKSLFSTLYTYTETGGQVFITGTDGNALKTSENHAFLVDVGAMSS